MSIYDCDKLKYFDLDNLGFWEYSYGMGERLSGSLITSVGSGTEGVTRRWVVQTGAKAFGLTIVGGLTACIIPEERPRDENDSASGFLQARETLQRLHEQFVRAQLRGVPAEPTPTSLILSQIKWHDSRGSRKKITVEFSATDPTKIFAIEVSTCSFDRDPTDPDNSFSHIFQQRRSRLAIDGDHATLVLQNTARGKGSNGDGFMQFTEKFSTNLHNTVELQLPHDTDFVSETNAPAQVKEVFKSSISQLFESDMKRFEGLTSFHLEDIGLP